MYFAKRKTQSSHILMMYGGEGGLWIYFNFSDDLAITVERSPSIWGSSAALDVGVRAWN